MSRGVYLDHSRPSAVVTRRRRDQSERRNLFFTQSLIIRLNHARVALAVESHREGTVVGRFFPTEVIRSWH